MADPYEIKIFDRHLKDTVKSISKANLSEMGVLPTGQEKLPCPTNFAFQRRVTWGALFLYWSGTWRFCRFHCIMLLSQGKAAVDGTGTAR